MVAAPGVRLLSGPCTLVGHRRLENNLHEQKQKTTAAKMQNNLIRCRRKASIHDTYTKNVPQGKKRGRERTTESTCKYIEREYNIAYVQMLVFFINIANIVFLS